MTVHKIKATIEIDEHTEILRVMFEILKEAKDRLPPREGGQS